MSTMSTILFDLDETLVHPPDDGDERLAAAFEATGVDPFFSVEDFNRWIPKVEANSPLDLRVKCFRNIAGEKGHPREIGKVVAHAFEMPTPSEFTPNPATRNVIETFRERDYKLGLVTNGSEQRQQAKLRQLGLEDVWDAEFFGTPENGLKPDPIPFKTVLDDLEATPKNAIFVGDSRESDIEPAYDLGMTTIWTPSRSFRDSTCEKADLVIEDLTELVDEPWQN